MENIDDIVLGLEAHDYYSIRNTHEIEKEEVLHNNPTQEERVAYVLME